MAYLFISFADRLDRDISTKNELFGDSLRSQFNNLQKRIPLRRQTNNFQRFIETCFPTGLAKKYYISCPNFLREKNESKSGKTQFLDNVVIRPELTMSMRSYLPDNQNVILIGKIVEGGKQKLFEVKGIQLIDDSMRSPHDLVVSAMACNSFAVEKRSGVNGTFNVSIWSIPNVDYNETYFTPNNVYELIRSCYTVSQPEEVRKKYEEWNKYIEFRNYYLQEQSKRNFKLDSAQFVKAYAVNRKEYRRNSSIYEDYLLDKRPEFSYGEMILLSDKIEEAEEFPVVRLTIDRNKKSFEAAKVLKRGKNISEEERAIRSLASDNVFITSLDPMSIIRNDEHPKIGDMLSAGYALGDRFKVFSYDILPEEHLAELEYEHDIALDEKYKSIDSKYEKKIASEVEALVKKLEKEYDSEIESSLKNKKKELALSLDSDVKENKDTKILAKIQNLQSQIKKEIVKKNPKDKKEKETEYQERISKLLEKEYSKIDITSLYKERNEELLAEFERKTRIEYANKLKIYRGEKETEISNKYKDDIRNEKISAKESLDESLRADKQKVIDEETIIRFALYFRLGDTNNVINDKQIKIINSCSFIVYDSRAEKAKIARQEQALKNFYSGYVKNPYLSTYLFNPEELNSVQAEPSDWTWYLDSLNDMQKEAVRKAVSSNGIFLLQGPPGTGKTQVIAETVAQMVKKGKKVLISSETHKAIDNVFERLPKIAEIVPLRLIPSINKKDNEYDPKYLVDNFYTNISSNMKKSIERYRNFKKNKEEFREKYDLLKLLKSKVDKSIKVLEAANNEIKGLEKKSAVVNSEITGLNNKKDTLRIDIDVLRRTIRHIENDNLKPDEDVKADLIVEYRNSLSPLFARETFLDKDIGVLVKLINAIKPEDINRELAILNPESNKTLLEIKRKEIKISMDKCKDDFDEVLPDKQDEYDRLRKELIDIKKQIDADSEKMPDDLKLGEIFNFSYLVANSASIYDLVISIKEQISELKYTYIEKVKDELTKVESEQEKLDIEIESRKKIIKGLNEQIIDIQDRNDVKEVQENKYKLESGIIQFFRDFEISEPFNDIDEALVIIKRKWDELDTDYSKKESENKEKIPMYEKISNYITTEDVIEGDRKDYTKELFENANVFGITCTSSDYFTSRNVDSLSEYNIESIDIKSAGIDVVIIDEVSKSSFIDLLIPILYGKTVILVGDHRQLPPMYEFSKLRDDDFEGLDDSIINKDINKRFTELYEECFFKTLFEKIPSSYKTMLVQQYRCHEHIMNVFNHFYRNELKLGWPGQNNAKQHNVKLFSNGRNIIEPSKHIYFIDCKGNETHEADSTSMYNSGEAKVVAELLRKLNTYFKENPSHEKLSIGIICTYGDQARRIKEVIKSEKVKTDAFKTDVEKMIVSTVDDFQGDERDIIILSTVRNPEDPRRSNPGFILAYQRINVALSRARRMLVIVGNRNYLESKGVIDLPDVYGRPGMDQHNFRVYEEILSTIERYGKVLDDTDIIGDKEARING